MSDYPHQHQTTTTATTVTVTRIQPDLSYFKTIPGLLRIAEIILCLIVFICSVSACSAVYYSYGACGWSGFVSFVAFLLVLCWLIFYSFHIHELAPPNIPWLLVELVVYAVWTFLFLTAGIALAVLSSDVRRWGYWYGGVRDAAGAGSFFAFVTMVIFGYHTFLIFKEYRANRAEAASRGQTGRA